MIGPQQLELAQIDVRFSSLRLADPEKLRKLRASVQIEGKIREPVMVSAGVEDKRWVLVDGFKRLRVAEDLGLTHVWAQVVQLDAKHAKAAILQRNEARAGVSAIEEAWVVQSLLKEQHLTQEKVAQLLQRTQSWVSRRMALVENLEESLQIDVRLGLLPVTTARELALMPRGIRQVQAAQAVRDHQLNRRQCAMLVQRLKQTRDPQAARGVLEDPLRHIEAGTRPMRDTPDDPRLSEPGNQLRRQLAAWEDSCGRLTRQLRYPLAAADAPLLAPLLQDAVRSATRLLRQLEARHGACSEQLAACKGLPGQPTPAQESVRA